MSLLFVRRTPMVVPLGECRENRKESVPIGTLSFLFSGLYLLNVYSVKS